MVQLFIFHVLSWLAHVEYFKSVNNYNTYSFQALLVSCLGFHCWKNYYCEVDIYHVQIHFFVINIENSLIHSQSWKIFIINVIAMIKMLLFCYSHVFGAVLPHPPWIFILFVELKTKKKICDPLLSPCFGKQLERQTMCSPKFFRSRKL